MTDEQQRSIDTWKEILANASAMGETPEQKKINDSFRQQLQANEAKLKGIKPVLTERQILIDQLDRSFKAMSITDKSITKHSMGAPTINPETGENFKSFREVIEQASDQTLDTLREDFQDNRQLLPAVTN